MDGLAGGRAGGRAGGPLDGSTGQWVDECVVDEGMYWQVGQY